METREIKKGPDPQSAGNKSRKASDLLGITRFTLQRKLDKYELGADGASLAPGESPETTG